MSIDSENNSTPAAEAPATKASRKAKKAKPAKKAGRSKNATAKPKADHTNKKAVVIEMMKRAKGATLPEIRKATGLAAAHRAWLRQHPGQQGRGEDRVLQERRRRTDVQDREIAQGNSSSKRRLRSQTGAAFLLSGASK